MTALCGGGVSGPKAGVAETVIFTAGALASVLNNKGGAWAMLAAPLLGVLTYQVEDLCENDPPADPGLTSADYLALLSLNDWPAVQVALGKLAELIKIAVWYDLCECKTVGTPAFPPALLAPPADTQMQPTTSSPCWSSTKVYDAPYRTGSNAADFRVDIFPPAEVIPVLRADLWSGGNAPFIDTPSAWKSYRLSVRSLQEAPAGQWNKAAAKVWETNDTSTGSVTGPQGNAIVWGANEPSGGILHNTDSSTPINWPNGGLSLEVLAFEGHAIPHRVQVTFDAFCGEVGAVSDCSCNTDPAVMALLQQILQLVTVTQRQAAPFGYVPAGDLSISGDGVYVIDTPLIAASVVFTTLPGHYGMAEGSPDRLFDVGYLARGTIDGFEDPRRITSSPFLLRLEGHHTRLGYSLAPGVVATLKLHQREP